MLRPGAERVARLGGLHRFMRWDGPILTDSGGYQVMSLAERRKLTERGVVFSSHLDGSRHELTPERSVEIQHLLDATITMVLDECLALPAAEAEVARAMELSLRWAERSKAAFVPRPGYGLFGIVQGGTDPALRARSRRGLVGIGFDGYAIGGLAVGEPQELMFATLDATCPLLPADRPRYLMGVGKPADLVGAVAARHRHVRLRPAHPLRPHRPGLHPPRHGQPQERPPRRRPAPARRGIRLPGRARLFPRLPAPPGPLGRDPGRDPADLEQSLVLPGPDARPAGRDRGRRLADFAAAFHEEQARGDLPPWP